MDIALVIQEQRLLQTSLNITLQKSGLTNTNYFTPSIQSWTKYDPYYYHKELFSDVNQPQYDKFHLPTELWLLEPHLSCEHLHLTTIHQKPDHHKNLHDLKRFIIN